MPRPGPLGILGAMEQEVGLLRNRLEDAGERSVAGRIFTTGMLGDHRVVVAVSGFGKVASASTATTMLDLFSVDAVVVSGVAGGVGRGVAVGDVVVADALVQHDFDASPIFPRFVVPSVGRVAIGCDAHLRGAARKAAAEYLERRFTDEVTEADREAFEIGAPSVHVGLVASGDRFVADPRMAADLAADLPGLLAVEMEGAAVAQVCAERAIPCAVVRTISDRADREAAIDFARFVSTIAAPMGSGILEELVRLL